jgi:hypothetical protein
VLTLLALAPGCVTTGAWVSGLDNPPPKPACQVVATWTNQVLFTPDPVHNGEPTPGIAGRIYLFGPTVDYPVPGDGTLTIDLFDEAHPSSSQPPVPLEEWRIDRDTLKRLEHRDAIGQGYTLFLPWGTYRPDITRVRIKVRYDPAKGGPLYASGAPLTLNKDISYESGSTAAAGSARANPVAAAGAVRSVK